MENKSRNVFGIHGVTGMLIATVLLLSILGGLTYLAIVTQQSVMDKPYKLENVSDVKEKSSMAVKKNTMIVKE